MKVAGMILELAKALGYHSAAMTPVHVVGPDGQHRNVKAVKYDSGSDHTPPCVYIEVEEQ